MFVYMVPVITAVVEKRKQDAARAAVVIASGGSATTGMLSNPLISNPSGDIVIAGPSGGNDRPLIQAKITEAIASGNHRVVLKAGTYNLIMDDPTRMGNLEFIGGRDITLMGETPGAVTLNIVGNARAGICVSKTRNLTLANLNVDYQDHLYGQGTITSVDANTKTVWVKSEPRDQYYKTWNNQFYRESRQQLYLTRTNRLHDFPNCDVLPAALPGSIGFSGGLNFFKYNDLGACRTGLAPGQRVVLNVVSWDDSAIRINDVEGALIKDVTIYSSPGVTVYFRHARPGDGDFQKITIDGLKIMYSPMDETREISSNADGVHVSGSRAPFVITNSTFSGFADDAINLHAPASQVNRIFLGGTPATTPILQFTPSDKLDVEAGERLEIFNAKRLTHSCFVTATSVPYNINGAWFVNLTAGDQTCAITEKYNGTNPTTADRVVNLAEANKASTISGNFFYSHRGRDVLNQFANTVIQNNVFGRAADTGSALDGHSNWAGVYEGFCIGDLQFFEGALIYPGHLSGPSFVNNNSGFWGNTIGGCFP